MEKFFAWIGRAFENVMRWILWSSMNQGKVSLTLKAGIPFLLLFHIGSTESLDALADSLVNFIVMTGTWLTGAIALYAALRKIIITVHNFFLPQPPF